MFCLTARTDPVAHLQRQLIFTKDMIAVCTGLGAGIEAPN